VAVELNDRACGNAGSERVADVEVGDGEGARERAQVLGGGIGQLHHSDRIGRVAQHWGVVGAGDGEGDVLGAGVHRAVIDLDGVGDGEGVAAAQEVQVCSGGIVAVADTGGAAVGGVAGEGEGAGERAQVLGGGIGELHHSDRIGRVAQHWGVIGAGDGEGDVLGGGVHRAVIDLDGVGDGE